jgi:archaellum biogenesis protein FlaJ (TadC family)
MTEEATAGAADEAVGRHSRTDRGLYALFSRHADSRAHQRDRDVYRGTDVGVDFETYLVRVYGVSWVVGVLVAVGVAVAGGLALPAPARRSVVGTVLGAVPGVRPPPASATAALGTLAVGCGLAGKRGVVWVGGRYLRWRARARRVAIERTLPGAVRYLRVLATGSDDRRTMLRKVADNRDAYGETAVAARRVLNKAALVGSLDEGLRIVARDTPSRNALAPFLLKFREHARQGEDALESYLRMESRMLSHRQDRERAKAEGFLELVSELFVVLLVLPALFVIVVTVMSVLSPGLNGTVETPAGTVPVRTVLVATSAGFILVVGACTAWIVGSLRPPAQSAPTYALPGTLTRTLTTASSNPTSAAVVCLPPALGVGVWLSVVGVGATNAVLLAYVALALPVGAVAVQRARLDDAKDRELKDFVHAVSGHVALGRPFGSAVELVAREVDLGALDADVADLAFNANLTTRDEDLRTASLERFVDRVGTPLAEQTVGLITGALDAGSDAEDVFETLQTEVGRLYHEKKSLRDAMLVYVAVGWTTALLVVGIAVAVNTHVLDSFAQLSAASSQGTSMIQRDAVDLQRERHRFYVITQATMLACGWFSGMASRGRYDALLHSGMLVAVASLVFAGVGMA